MEVICLQDEALYMLIDRVVQRIKESENIKENKWITTVETMDLLGIKSKTTLQKLRDTGKIRFSQDSKKVILYDRDSVIEYIEKHVKNKF